jgi:hypothetical protein
MGSDDQLDPILSAREGLTIITCGKNPDSAFYIRLPTPFLISCQYQEPTPFRFGGNDDNAFREYLPCNGSISQDVEG